MRMVDKNKFVVGDNLACTPGKIIFSKNPLVQLIQYQPTTKMAYEVPLLIIPPWINKYYILDLRPEKFLGAMVGFRGVFGFCYFLERAKRKQ